jgi:hypothetical protein
MTSQRNEKRMLRKCELSLETLGARIAPVTGFLPSSFMLAQVVQHPTGIYGSVQGTKFPAGTPFQTYQTGMTNYIVRGETTHLGSVGSGLNGVPF